MLAIALFVQLVLVQQVFSSPPAPVSGHRYLRKKDGPSIVNPLVAARQLNADALRRSEFRGSSRKRQSNECPTPQVSGGCCPPGTTLCTDPSGSIASCVILSSDINNCGTCGNACDLEYQETCLQGNCCVTGMGVCNGQCAAILSDPDNCGVSCAVCESYETCFEGACVGDCTGEGAVNCDNACVNILTDANNCGECRNQCDDGDACMDGLCCASGFQANCNGVCVEFLSDVNNCGTGCQTCTGENPFCDEGTCANCASGQTVCQTFCADLTSDPENCGSCYNACSEGAPSCINGQCCPANSISLNGICVPATCTESTECLVFNGFCDNGECAYCNEGNVPWGALITCGGNCVSAIDSTNCGACGNTCMPLDACTVFPDPNDSYFGAVYCCYNSDTSASYNCIAPGGYQPGVTP